MTATTNPRKVYETGGAVVVSLPTDFRNETGIKPGDQVVLEETEHGFEAVRVEFRRVESD